MKKSINNAAQLESLVRSIYEAESKKIGIEIPVEFTSENKGYLASCNYYATRNLFGRITSIEAAHSITFDIEALDTVIRSVLFTKRARRLAAKYIVLHTVRHELRHAWQTRHNKDILMGNNGMFALDTVNGYGKRPHEEDANKYAESIDVKEFNILLQACTFNQDMAGKAFLSNEDRDRAQLMTKGLIKINLQLALGLIGK